MDFNKTNSKPYGLDVVGLILLAITISAIAFRNYQHLPTNGLPEKEWAQLSYRDVIYYPARAVADGVNPYDSSKAEATYMDLYPVADHFPLYSPILLLICAPLVFLEVKLSLFCFFALSVVALIAFVYLVFRAIGKKPSVFLLCMVCSLVMLSQVGRAILFSGQIAPFFSLAVLGIFVFLERNRWLTSVFYLIALMKPTIGGPIALLMMARGFIRSSFWGLVVGCSIFLLGVAAIFLATGSLSVEGVQGVIGGNLEHFHNDPVVVTSNNFSRIEIMAVAEYLVGRRLPDGASIIVAFGLIAVTAWILWKEKRNHSEREIGQIPGRLSFAGTQAAALITLTMFVCYYHNVYDLPLLLVPILALIFVEKTEFLSYSFFLRIVLVALLCVPFGNVIWTEGFRSYALKLVNDSQENIDTIAAFSQMAAPLNGIALLGVWVIIAKKMVLAAIPNSDLVKIDKVR